MPAVVEEQTQVSAPLRSGDFIEKNAEKFLCRLFQLRVEPYAQKIGIRLDDMQMGIHRFGRVGIFLAQTHVGDRLPVAGKGFDVTSLDAVAAVILDVVEEADGVVKSFGVACRTGIFRQTVDGEPDGVELFFCVEGLAVGAYRPVYAAVFAVVETVDDLAFCAGGGFEISIVAYDAVCGRERPQYTGIQDRSLGSIGIETVVAVASSVESAAWIGHPVGPVGEYVCAEVFHNLRTELLFSHITFAKSVASSSVGVDSLKLRRRLRSFVTISLTASVDSG